MDTNKKTRELISAFSDAEIPDADRELALAALGTPDGQAAWETYHRIGDTLRAAPTPELSPGFAARLALRLAAEAPPGARGTASTEPDSPSAIAAGPH